MTQTMDAGFRAFYERFYRHDGPCLTTADELRDVLRAYKAFRLHNGLADCLDDPERETLYAARLDYHIGACELAELTGNATRAVKHRQAFMDVWERWFNELCGDPPTPLPPLQETQPPKTPKARRGYWSRLVQALKQWRA